MGIIPTTWAENSLAFATGVNVNVDGIADVDNAVELE